MTEKDFEQFWDIYDKAFPTEEKREKQEQRKLLEDSSYEIKLYYEQSEVIGFVALWNLDTLTFMEHFAIKEGFRGKGLGRRILEDIKHEYKSPLILEVELPDESIAVKRIDFYKRAGFYYNTYSYFQPPYQSEGKAVELSIMSYPTAISKETFENIRKTLYSSIYNV